MDISDSASAAVAARSVTSFLPLFLSFTSAAGMTRCSIPSPRRCQRQGSLGWRPISARLAAWGRRPKLPCRSPTKVARTTRQPRNPSTRTRR